MQKGTLNPNILKKAKQRFKVRGLDEVIVITRGTIDVGVGAIELPDGTKHSGGRTEPGEFTVTLQFADDKARNAYLRWFNMAKDDGTERGIDPEYKRDAEIRFLRAYNSNGRDDGEVQAELTGVWCMKYVIPDGDIDATDGDGDTQLECTISYDDAKVIETRNSLGL